MTFGDVGVIFAIISAVVAGAFAVYIEHARRKAEELRHRELLLWATSTIELMRILSARMAISLETGKSVNIDMGDLRGRLSAAADQGRLYFRNVTSGNAATYGIDKPQAYRGLRPRILDCIVAAFDAATEWHAADFEKKARLCRAVDGATREFVSFAQEEIGRTRVAAASAAQAGQGSPLRKYLN